MAKRSCSLCDEKLGFFSLAATIKDGLVCMKCQNKANINLFDNTTIFDTVSLKEYIDARSALVNSFSPTKMIGTKLKIDSINKVFVVDGVLLNNKEMFEFSNLLDCELLEDEVSIVKGGAGSAIAGGLLFGGAGAVAGSVLGKRTKDVCASMKIALTLRNSHKGTAFIELINHKTKIDSSTYRAARDAAQQCLSELQIIDQREVLGKDFKIYGDFENPIFVAQDVAEWIGHRNTTEMMRMVDESEKLTSAILRAGQRREVQMLTEDGLYEVLMQSRKPIAKEFKRKVKEVLRSIRKHGAYMTEATIDKVLADPDFGIRLLTQLKEEQGRNKALQAENDKQRQLIGELQPKVDYVDRILSSTGTMTAGQIAADYGISAVRLNRILKEERIHRKIGDQWILYAEHMNKGYTKSETIEIERSDGTPDTKLFTKWTQRGRLMINEVLNKRGIYANMDLIQAA